MTNSKPAKHTEMASLRIRKLFALAHDAKTQELSDRYVALARRIAMKYRIRVPAELRKSYCKHCYAFLRPGLNARKRVREGFLITYCMRCKKIAKERYK